MNKKKHQNVPMRLGSRPGEAAVPVRKVTVTLPDGTSALRVDLDLSRVPLPDKSYLADCAGVIYDEGQAQVKLLFGQRKVVGDELRSLIVIIMSSDAIHQFLTSCKTF